MFSTDRILMRGAIAIACLTGLGGVALADTLVVRAGGPSARSYPAGKTLPANAKITLVAGDSLTVLDSKGTRTLRGPGTYSAEASAGAQSNTSFSRLVSTQNKRRARTGAVRGTDRTARPSNLWDVDTGRSTTMCVAETAGLRLWRSDKEGDAVLTLTNDASGKSTRVTFRSGTQEAGWPADMPVAEGTRYTLTRAAQATPVKIAFARFAGDVQDPANTASALLAKGCSAQYDLLVAALEAQGGAL
ncbi:hypothetical protein [Sphingomonas cavernae]|uniref:Uncharacterized protein n=1 Tax=Sphingomonas cavernae TaxID=2320861 RepID=A0A418WPH9_9SPHN|nr:hypothetical protein [Sphingomonas cavernae]RJF93162.1 hypothetical protein D3876_02010 [Sphingomonas cavernae]